MVDKNEVDLFNALKLLVNNEKIRKEMGENGKKIIQKKFLWDKVAVSMIQAYTDIIERYQH